MPSLGADMDAGTLTRWYVKSGDTVHRGDTIAAVETDKATIDVETFDAGVVDRLVAEPGQRLPVGTILAYIRPEGAPPAPAPAVVPLPALRVRASPAARKLARDLGIDLAAVTGTGPHGVIERADVERATPAAAPPPTPRPAAAKVAATEAPAGLRHAIALAMARSNREIPHYYVQTKIDMAPALRHLETVNAQRPVATRILPAALLLRAVARALVTVPALNGYWIDDRPQPQEGIHLGVAIALRQGGLIVPAMHDVDTKSLDEVMEALRDLIVRTRSGRLRSSEMTDATITVTNLGDLGVETVYGVIYPPQIALVGFGKIVERPWADAGMIGIRPVLTATLAGDHRATDGHQGAQFLNALGALLAHPEMV